MRMIQFFLDKIFSTGESEVDKDKEVKIRILIWGEKRGRTIKNSIGFRKKKK